MNIKVGDGDLILLTIAVNDLSAAQEIDKSIETWINQRGLTEVTICAYKCAPTDGVPLLQMMVLSVNDIFDKEVLSSGK